MLDELKLLPEWGNGYATEVGWAALSLAFDEIGADVVCAPIHPENVASRHVAEKIGMTTDGLVDVYGDGVFLENFLMTRERWLSLRTAK